MKRLDLSNDYTDLYDFVAKRANSFDPTTNPGPGRGQRVSRIGLGFDASDGGWACLVFDTRQNPKADIRWKESIDETGLRRPRWAKAYTALKAGPLALALHDGRKQDLPAGDTASLVAALGELMRVVLLQARNDGAFAALPKTPRCDLAVEDQAGSFCWPASGSDNRADPPGVGGQFALAADTKRVRDASRKRPAKRRLIPENDLEPLRAQVEQLADERDYAFPGLGGLPFYHAIVYYMMFTHLVDDLRHRLGALDDATALANAFFWYSVVFEYSHGIAVGLNPLADEPTMESIEGAPSLYFTDEDHMALIQASEGYLAARPLSRAQKAAARKILARRR